MSSFNPRRRDVRKSIGRVGVAALFQRCRQPDALWSVAYFLVFAIGAGLVAIVGQNRPAYRAGQVLSRPVVARVPVAVIDAAQTQKARDDARARVPSVYAPNEPYVMDVGRKLSALGKLAADPAVKSLAELSKEHVAQLCLTPDAFEAARRLVETIKLDGWDSRVQLFQRSLSAVAVLAPERFAIEQKLDKRSEQLVIVHPAGPVGRDFTQVHSAAEAPSDKLKDALMRCGEVFKDKALMELAAAVVLKDLQPTVLYDDAQTQLRRSAAANALTATQAKREEGAVIAKAGQRVDELTAALLNEEREQYFDAIGVTLPLYRLALLGLIAAISMGLWTYLWSYYHRVYEKPARGGALILLLLGSLAVSTTGSSLAPNLTLAMVAGPTLFVAMVLAIAYDQRFSLAITAIYALLVTVAMQLPASMTLVQVAGVTATAKLLSDVRSHSTLVGVGLWAGLGMSVVTGLTELLERPLHLSGELQAIGIDMGVAAGAGLLMGLLTQGVLPLLEQAFRVTTSMTLREINDATHPLLKHLAEEAPGTYQHSLRLADMAEAAATAIGGNSLLCRVGAMYHDIGKANKPAYFIENQGGGPNRHDKLQPAMSLLIIVGHVKDGVEMAHEYRLPRAIIHFIESHHGTTLVEYFYHAAKRRFGPDQAPTEFEFRYPGPKPRTKEAAILMIADACESAARALSEPTAPRLEQLVHGMAMKRLMDGQFDECNITLKELCRIESALTRTLCAIYHGRTAYPNETVEKDEDEDDRPGPKAATGT